MLGALCLCGITHRQCPAQIRVREVSSFLGAPQLNCFMVPWFRVHVCYTHLGRKLEVGGSVASCTVAKDTANSVCLHCVLVIISLSGLMASSKLPELCDITVLQLHL